MIRIVCPGCHSPLSSAELEQATIDGHLSLVCPECSMVLLTEPVDESPVAYSGEPGQRFHRKLDTHSRRSWTVGA